MHQLIVLGNGFDLTCGLKSKFSDFYSSRTDNTYNFNSIPNDQRNVWDLILSQVEKDDLLWCDIESLISTFVLRDGNSDSRVDKMYHSPVRTIDPTCLSGPFVPEDKVYQFVARSLGKEYVPQDELTNFLLSSLKEYERSFSYYLERQVEEDGEYIQKAIEYFTFWAR